MATNTITFGGNVLPCTIERFPTIRKPARKYRRFNIPGRNGDVFFQSDAWENVVQSYEVYAGNDATAEAAQVKWTDLAKLLYLNGYQILSDTYDTAHFRKAVFNGPLDVENAWNTHGRATLEFDCRPERYLVNGAQKIHYEEANNAAFYTLERSEVYSGVNDFFKAAGYESKVLYAFDIPTSGMAFYTFIYLAGAKGVTVPGWFLTTGADPSQELSWEPAGQISSVDVNGLATFQTTRALIENGTTLVIPSLAVMEGIPYVMYAATMPPDPQMEYVGGPVALDNPYMPSHPNLVLKCTRNHTSEICAAIIDKYGIYITDGNTSTPYYFIDTENMTVSKGPSLTGDRFRCDNVRIDAGIQLKSGTNQIFTSAFYEMDLYPNWWEL